MYRPASLVAGLFLTLIALAQLCRAILGLEIIVGGVRIAVWLSYVAFVFVGALVLWLVSERSRSQKSAGT